MQFHLNGFQPGDPDKHPAASPKEGDVDVLIVGAGPAGLTLAACLAGFPGIRTALVERKSGPLEKGQADGVSCRSMEMFQAFGFAERVKREAYWVNEATFWKPDPHKPEHIIRSGRVRDVEVGLSEMPHVILNQARVHDMFLDVMRHAPTRLEPLYDHDVTDLHVDADGVRVHLDRNGRAETMRARYVVGCDGARSTVRQAIGGQLEGKSAQQAWGVMDILANTDFPDIRFKSLIQSATEGSMLVIPREGGFMVRLYVELDELNAGERVTAQNLHVSDLISAANRIIRPFSVDVKEVVWWSAYEIGHRLTQRFDDGSSPTPRVFIAGDACHTHSPKAGQGMNVSMGDAFNLGWKLASVLTGQSPANLLASYSRERHGVAHALIDFDAQWAAIMSASPEGHETDGKIQPKMQEYFVEHGRYTAGLSVKYPASNITGPATWQELAIGFPIGMRFHSAPVVRLADAKPVHLGHVQHVGTRWVLCAFVGAGDTATQIANLHKLSFELTPIVQRFTRPDQEYDDVLDVRAILQAHPHDLNITDVPELLFPTKGRLGLRDYEKVFCADPDRADIFEVRGIERQNGCLVLVRPDQYVAHVLPSDGAEQLENFLSGILRTR